MAYQNVTPDNAAVSSSRLSLAGLQQKSPELSTVSNSNANAHKLSLLLDIEAEVAGAVRAGVTGQHVHEATIAVIQQHGYSIGLPKNAFLHYWDILPSAADSSIEVVRVNRSAKKRKNDKITIKDIPNLYPVGTEIVVQVTKGPIGTKGPRTTTNLSLPGRFIVLMPYSDQCGISRKIEDNKERSRLKKIIQSLHSGLFRRGKLIRQQCRTSHIT